MVDDKLHGQTHTARLLAIRAAIADDTYPADLLAVSGAVLDGLRDDVAACIERTERLEYQDREHIIQGPDDERDAT